MTGVTLTIHGKPFAKQRARFVRSTGRAYTPKATETFESIVRGMALEVFTVPLEGPIGVDVLAIFEPPPSWSKRKRAELLDTWHEQKPDGDNIMKAIMDGLNRVAFEDDSHVASQSCRKVWGPKAMTLVNISSLFGVPANPCSRQP